MIERMKKREARLLAAALLAGGSLIAAGQAAVRLAYPENQKYSAPLPARVESAH